MSKVNCGLKFILLFMITWIKAPDALDITMVNAIIKIYIAVKMCLLDWKGDDLIVSKTINCFGRDTRFTLNLEKIESIHAKYKLHST